jgi:predicted nuclease of predicted toxin-antitoxin system
VRFVVDADLPRSVSQVIAEYGHEAVDVRDIGMMSASDDEIVQYARNERLCLLSADLGFADVRRYLPSKYHGIVVMRLPRHATSSFIERLLSSFLGQLDTFPELRGKLAIVDSGRVRIRAR